MAIRFCLKNKGCSFPAVTIDKDIFINIKKEFRNHPSSEYVDIIKDGEYLCTSYNDSNADTILNHILSLQSSSNVRSFFSSKTITIYSLNELSFEFYNLCRMSGAAVHLKGPLWSEIEAVSTNIQNIKPDYELFSEGNPGFSLKDFWHLRNVFPKSQFSFIEDVYQQYNATGRLYNGSMLKDEDVFQWLSHRINNRIPSMVARLGNTESIIATESVKGMISLYWKGWLTKSSGFYSNNLDYDCDKYANLTIEAIKNCDMHLCHFESSIPLINQYSKQDSVIAPWYSLFIEKRNRVWLSLLAGKNILIISSINNLIRRQLSTQSRLLPKCNIQYYTCPETYFQSQRHFDSWFKEYEMVKQEISLYKFDIAIIAAGAYGYPLSSFIKDQGGIAIELCSGLYPIFMIKNKTQSIIPLISKQYNDTWISSHDCDCNNIDVEKGAYWY